MPHLPILLRPSYRLPWSLGSRHLPHLHLGLMLSALCIPPFATGADAAEPAFLSWAATPPMGWNSWDCFGTTVTEAQVKAQADYMAAHLKAHGWEYIVVDIQWYEPGSQGHGYRAGAPLTMDPHGRLLPAPNKFPSSSAANPASSAGVAGFKPLADYVHARGLKFGVHLMRGIPRKAVEANLPVHGTGVRAADIANRASICPWNPDMYGVDTTKPGAQAYYDSVFALLAEWGVDYVKVDDIARPYHDHEKEIEAIRAAIDRTGRPMVLSLSPGETALTAAAHVTRHANLWRISDDFWDTWSSLQEQFGRLRNWNPHRRPGAWPDADMLPLGVLNLGERSTRFTPDEQHTLLTLWSIARSPLMHGGDMTRMDDFTLSLLTNDEVLAVSQRSAGNRPLFERDELVAWTADVPGSSDRYLALFNARGPVPMAPERAAFRSGVVTRATPGLGVDVDVDLAGAARLVLLAENAGTGNHNDVAVWVEPTLTFADGSTRSLTELKWSRGEALWDQLAATGQPGAKALTHQGRPIAHGIRAHAKSIIEYDLPPGVVRLRARGALEDRAAAQSGGGNLRFSVFTASATSPDLAATGLPVRVALFELGFTGPVRIRSLWHRQDLGEFRGEFAPVIPWHGAGLYRISPAP